MISRSYVAFGAIFLCLLSPARGGGAYDQSPGNFLPPQGPTEKLRFCDTLKPASEFPEGLLTVMTARITVTGDLRDVAVVESSGKPEFDKAAASCAEHTFVRPATKKGAPIEITWRFEVRWHASQHTFATIQRPQGYPISCAKFYPSDAMKAGEQGVSIVSYNIGTDGTVNSPAVLRSSGFADLDNAAMDCVRAWRYLPATVDGKPAEFEWKAVVYWRLS